MAEPAKKLDPSANTSSSPQTSTVGNVVYGAFGDQPKPKAAPPRLKKELDPKDLASLMAELNKGQILAGNRIFGGYLTANTDKTYEIRYNKPSEEFFLDETDTALFLQHVRHHLKTEDSGNYFKKITALSDSINAELVEAGITKEAINLPEFLDYGISKSNNIQREKEHHELKTSVEILAVLAKFVASEAVTKKPATTSSVIILTFKQLAQKPVENWLKIRDEVIEVLLKHEVLESSFTIFQNEGPFIMPPIRDGINTWLNELFTNPTYTSQLAGLSATDFFLPPSDLTPEQLNSVDKEKLSLILDKLDPILMAILEGKEAPAVAAETPPAEDIPDGGEAEITQEPDEAILPETLDLAAASQFILQNQAFIDALKTALFVDEYAELFPTLTPDQLTAIQNGTIIFSRASQQIQTSPLLTEIVGDVLQQQTYLDETNTTQQLVVNDLVNTNQLRALVGDANSRTNFAELFISYSDITNQLGDVISLLIAALRQANELPPEEEPEPTEEVPPTEEAQPTDQLDTDTTAQTSPQPGVTTPSQAPVVGVASIESIYAQYQAAQGAAAATPTKDDWFAWWTDSQTKTQDKIKYLQMIGALPTQYDQLRMGAAVDFMIANALNIDVNSAEFKQYNTTELRDRYWAALSGLDAQTVYSILNNPTAANLELYNQNLVLQFGQLRQSVLIATYKLQESRQDRELSQLQTLLLGDRQFSFVDKQNIDNGVDALQIYFKDPERYIDRLTVKELLSEFGITSVTTLTPEQELAFKTHLKAYLRARGYAAILTREFKRQIDLGLISFKDYLDDEKLGQEGLAEIRKYVKNVSSLNKPGKIPQGQRILFTPTSTITEDGETLLLEELEDDHRVTASSEANRALQDQLVKDYWRAYYAANRQFLEQQYAEEIKIDPGFLNNVPPGMSIAEAALLANQRKTGGSQKASPTLQLAKSLAGMGMDAAAGAVVPGGSIASRLARNYFQGAYDILRGRATKEAGVTAIVTATGAYAVKLLVDTVLAAASNWGAFMGGMAGMSLTGGSPIGFLIGSKIGDALLPNFKIFGMSGPLDFTHLNLGHFSELFNSFLANLSNFGGTGLAATAAPPVTAMFVGTILSLLTSTALLVSFIYNVPTEGSLNTSGLDRDSGDFCYPVDGIITQLDTPEHLTYNLSGFGQGSAIDIGCAFGAEIVAPFDGELEYHTPTTGVLGFTKTVNDAGKSVGPGFYATITSPSGLKAGFLHMVDFGTKKPPRGSGSVQAGEVIGYCDSTGNSTGNHLHYEVWGKPIRDVLPVAPVIGQPVSSRTCKNIGPTNTECFDTSGIKDAAIKKKVDDALDQIKGSFSGYVANVCEAQPTITFSAGGDYCTGGDCRYAGSRSGSITIYNALLNDGRGQSAIVYTMVHELAHQMQFGGSPLYSEFVSTVYNKEANLLDNYRFNPSDGEDFAETAAYYADTLLYGTGSPYNKYKATSPKHFEFASQKLF